MIIWLASYPRSGNTYFRIFLNQAYGIKTYSIYNDPWESELKGFASMVGHENLSMTLEEMANSTETFIVKTHNLPADSSPAIYLVRDGRDSLVSYAYYILSLRQRAKSSPWQNKIKKLLGWNEYASVLKSLIVSPDENYGTWTENVQRWRHRVGKTVTIKFEDLIKNPFEHIEKALYIISFLEKQPRMTCEIPSFEELHTQWPSFFRSGRIGGWRQEMNKELQDLFWQKNGDVMQDLGYKK